MSSIGYGAHERHLQTPRAFLNFSVIGFLFRDTVTPTVHHHHPWLALQLDLHIQDDQQLMSVW